MHPQDLSIHDYTYDLPEDRIARQPLAERDASRLLVHRNGHIEDHRFQELPGLIPPGALLVLNETRVVRARIHFRRATGAGLECMVLAPEDGRPMETALLDKGCTRWWCMMGNAKRWKGEELTATVDGTALNATRTAQRNGEHLIEFGYDPALPFVEVLKRVGTVPLPPYMRREAMPSDITRYNTVFATQDGSIAAPTASLHFTEALLAQARHQGIHTTSLTLHVGAGTFLPVKADHMADHVMHTEQVSIPLAALLELREHLGRGAIIPVGTTALRTLESIHWHGAALLCGRGSATMQVGQWEPYGRDGEGPTAAQSLDAVIAQVEHAGGPLTGHTALLIAPGYQFRFADGLITNFHQPQSTLLLLVAAFVGPTWRDMYGHALKHGYRFLSYGDASLLLRPSG
ncbi:MAG: S-adenosylmethionine:tRNA ribosyltransferase-isomerase [Flavobacteriales bacterium]|nr:S-adenosylmethionine:tRNA ribosyltransferase-isomerase [Flavobacteriales bacterium]